MLVTPNISSKVLIPNTYICNSTSIIDSPWNIMCLENGNISITPIKGDSFNWNAKTNEKINIIPRTITINSGIFIVFFAIQKTNTNGEIQELFFVIDENSDTFIHENNNKFLLK